MVRIAHVTVYVRGQELKPELMTEPETIAITECVNDLFRTYGSKTVFDTSLEEDEDGTPVFLVRCYEYNRMIPFPKEWVIHTVAFASGKVYRLFGSKIPVTPCPYQHAAWDFVEVKLTDYEEE